MIRLLATLLFCSVPGLSYADDARDLKSLVTDRDAEIYAVGASPSGRFMVAVGEDDSERTRKLQMLDEHHEAVILVSTDAGRSWARNSAGGDSVPFDSVIVLDEKHAVISGAMEGAGGVILRTRNRGKDWKQVYEGGMIHDLARNSEQSIWAAGYGLLHSTNGGKSWKESDVPKAFYYAVHAVDEKVLIAVGDSGMIRTTDAGRRWQPVALPQNMGGFNRIDVHNGQLRMTSWNEETLVSDDAGRSWRKR